MMVPSCDYAYTLTLMERSGEENAIVPSPNFCEILLCVMTGEEGRQEGPSPTYPPSHSGYYLLPPVSLSSS